MTRIIVNYVKKTKQTDKIVRALCQIKNITKNIQIECAKKFASFVPKVFQNTPGYDCHLFFQKKIIVQLEENESQGEAVVAKISEIFMFVKKGH